MIAIITKFFIKKFKTLNVIHIINGALVAIYALTFPMLATQQETLSVFIKGMPEGFIKAFSLDTVSMITFEGYLATKHFTPIWIVILLVIAIPAGTFIGKAVDNNTAELLFAQPISRFKASISVFLSGFLQVLYFAVVSILIIIPLCWVFNIEVHYSNYMLLMIDSIGFSFFVTALSFALDSLFGDSGKVSGLLIVFMIGSYVVDLVSKIITDLANLKYLSIFHYFDPSRSLANGDLNYLYMFGFWLFGGLLLGFALWRFNKKDLTR